MGRDFPLAMRPACETRSCTAGRMVRGDESDYSCEIWL